MIENNKILIAIEGYLRANSKRFFKTKAQNKIKIAEVDKNTNGVFSFQLFYSNNEKTVLDVWKYTAGWWTANANLTNSTPLSPLNKKCEYSLINHCKWNRLIDILPILILGRIGIIKGLNSFVLKNFTSKPNRCNACFISTDIKVIIIPNTKKNSLKKQRQVFTYFISSLFHSW